MEGFIGHAVSVFLGFFAIMNPIANTPVFLGLTAGYSEDTRRWVARKALIFAFVIIVVFCAVGKFIFELFGITLSAFRVTGGLLVFLVGFHMLQGEQSRVHQPSAEDVQKHLDAELEVAITPLAMPSGRPRHHRHGHELCLRRKHGGFRRNGSRFFSALRHYLRVLRVG